MRSRWNANTVLLTVFVLILIGAGVDYGRRVLGGPEPVPEPSTVTKPSAPSFSKGDVAPDFALPDQKQKIHKLSDLIKAKTVLFFACGCANCKQVQTWMASMRTENKSDNPPVITVTSSPPESYDAWIRDTGLKQTMLFWKEGVSPDPMAIYKGKPCPRLYILNRDRTVNFIGASMSESPGVQAIGMEIVRELKSDLPATSADVQRIMKHKPAVTDQSKPSPDLPPYAQPQSAMPGATPPQ